MSRKVIGFTPNIDHRLGAVTAGKQYYFYGDNIFDCDNGGINGWSSARPEKLASYVEHYNATPIYKEIDLELLQRARDMVEHLKTLPPKEGGWIKNTGVMPRLPSGLIGIRWLDRSIRRSTSGQGWNWDLFGGDKQIEYWRPKQ